MIDFISYIEEIKAKHGIESVDFSLDISRFFVGNNWFGMKPIIDDGKIMVDDKFIAKVTPKIAEFCSSYGKEPAIKLDYIIEKFSAELPKTASFFIIYIKQVKLDTSPACQLADFLIYNLIGELNETDDREITDLLDMAYEELSKACSDILADFINWLKTKTKTVYQNVYFMNKYADKDDNGAYDPHSYLEILYHLFNADYIADNDMYSEAAKSKNYADTWLFLALHFLCALRNTDLLRIPHPKLVASPEETLIQIENGVFCKEDAVIILNSVIWHLEALMLTPNKTAGVSSVSSIKLHIPTSLEFHVGMLFALAEAHFQLSGADSSEPFIRVIQSYEQINRYMGEEIGELFLDSNFHSRAANKSYMQMIFLLTDDILGVNDEFKVKGYMLAALARSHKGSYGDFAKTTSVYLKDAKMSGYTPEFVAHEMLERGVLSLIPSMLLKMICGDDYNKMSVECQTKLIKALDMSPADIDKSVALMQVNMRRSVSIVESLYNNASKEDVLQVLHKIGNGEAASKCDGCMCLLTAMSRVCPFQDNHNCVSCEYEISTKTTMFLMAQECVRLKNEYSRTENIVEKKRCKSLVHNVIVPRIEEMLTIVEERYGKEGLVSLEKIIREINGGNNGR